MLFNLGGQGWEESSSSLKLLLVNARFIKNKTSLIHDLIDEEIDVVCIIETWVIGETDMNLHALFPPGFTVQHQPRKQGGGVVMVYKKKSCLP